MNPKKILQTIINHKKKEISLAKKKLPPQKIMDLIQLSHRSFINSLSRNQINLIAEIKKASPSEGILRDNFNHLKIFQVFEKYAAAVSILTDEKFFQGNLAYLKDIAQMSSIPLLRKDFIIDQYQIFESRYFGADAILLIASILQKKQIETFISLAKSLNMDSLVEVHDLTDLKKVLKIKNLKIIGINTRNLQDFSIDLTSAKQLLNLIPKKYIVVIESGLKNKNDLNKFKGKAHNFLIGSALMRAKSISKKLKSFF